MGHYADRYSRKTSGVGQKFFLNTGDASNFARKFLFYLPYIPRTKYFLMFTDEVDFHVEALSMALHCGKFSQSSDMV